MLGSMLPGIIWPCNCPPTEASASPVSILNFQPLSNFIEISPTQICDCEPCCIPEPAIPPLEQMLWTPAGWHCYALKPSNNRLDTLVRYNENQRNTQYHSVYRHRRHKSSLKGGFFSLQFANLAKRDRRCFASEHALEHLGLRKALTFLAEYREQSGEDSHIAWEFTERLAQPPRAKHLLIPVRCSAKCREPLSASTQFTSGILAASVFSDRQIAVVFIDGNHGCGCQFAFGCPISRTEG